MVTEFSQISFIALLALTGALLSNRKNVSFICDSCFLPSEIESGFYFCAGLAVIFLACIPPILPQEERYYDAAELQERLELLTDAR